MIFMKDIKDRLGVLFLPVVEMVEQLAIEKYGVDVVPAYVVSRRVRPWFTRISKPTSL